MRAALRARLELLRRQRGDGGQVIVIVLVVMLLLAATAPVVVGAVTGDAPLVVQSTDDHAALAADEAGISWYQNHLDADRSYYQETAGQAQDAALAAGGWCGAGMSSTCDLTGTSPPEAFHYSVDTSQLFATSGQDAGELLLTVTGRAGNPGSYAYSTVQAGFRASSILDNAYFSNYEVEDPASSDIQGKAVTVRSGGNSQSEQLTTYTVTYTPAGASSPLTQTLWQALCQYHTYSQNTFVDSVDSGSYNASSNPDYGPYSGSGFTFGISGGQASQSGSVTVTVPSQPCGQPFNFVSGESFSGPVYSNDQLHLCGNPDFQGSPVSFTSGAPSDVPYAYKVPGSIQVTPSNEAPNGPYPPSLQGQYVPAGTIDDCPPSRPTFAHGEKLNGNEQLPSFNSQLQADASGAGCLYTGPTMIELVTASGSTTMNVWSPMSSSTTGACSAGQTFSPSNPFITGIALPSNGVVYVQNGSGTAPSVPGLSGSGCPDNPYEQEVTPAHQTLTASDTRCVAGDAYVEGELSGQLTVGAAANVIVTRDLTYACASGPGPASPTNPDAVGACGSGSSPDVLGLDAQEDVVVAHPNWNQLVSSTTGPDGQHCAYDGTSYSSSQTLPPQTNVAMPAAVWPGCDIKNPVVDAAVLALQGSFSSQNYSSAPPDGNLTLNGADISDYRGQFGQVGSNGLVNGYYKVFNYDSRLAYVQPPDVLQSNATLWALTGWVACGNVDTAAETSPSCPPIG